MEAARPATRKPGRPATYVFDKPDEQLTEKERKLKSSIEKRRLRQNRSYHRRKALRAAQETAAANAKGEPSSVVPGLDPAATNALQQLSNFPGQPVLPSPVPSMDGIRGLPFPLLSSSSALAHGHPAFGKTRIPGVPPNGNPSWTTAVSGSASAVKPDVDMEGASIAARWGMPPPGAAPSPKLLDLTSPAPTPGLSLDGLPFAVVPDGEADGGEDDGTNELVHRALAQAQQSSQSNAIVPEVADLRGSMDQQRDLLRMAGIKDIVFDNLRTQFMGMPPAIQSALRHFVVFPGSFDLRAASQISGIDSGQLIAVHAMIEHMVGNNFVAAVGGRYQLNAAVKSFLCEDAAVAAIDPGDAYSAALTRFRSYFREQLGQFQDENIHKIGWRREQAMALYDSERENMQFAEFLSQRSSKMMLRDFLSAGITVMRYCVNAAEREAILLKALENDEASTFPSAIAGPSTIPGPLAVAESVDDSDGKRMRARDQANKARLQLALSEAYFDQLKVAAAEDALMQALSLMGGGENNVPAAAAAAGAGGRVQNPGSIADSVLVLLLLSNVRMASKRVKDARTLCVKALRILAAAGMGRSTFGINAMANLVAIYLEERHLDKAGVVAARLVDTLNNMEYSGMPIFADALGVCGTVSMAQGKFREAEQQFGSAVEIVRKWSAKEWAARPVQHCLDLDIWLIESLASAIAKQGRAEESALLNANAGKMRSERGLPSSGDDFFSLEHALEPIAERLKGATRHLY